LNVELKSKRGKILMKKLTQSKPFYSSPPTILQITKQLLFIYIYLLQYIYCGRTMGTK